MSAYSFLSVAASVVGPGLNAQVGSTSGSAKEGISVEFDEDKGAVTTGADGSIMSSLKATQTGRITIRLLKTSPLNAILSQAYAFQRQNAANWALNTIRIVDKARGDVAVGKQMNFVRYPSNHWSEEGNVLEWSFQGIVQESLGIGVPDLTQP